MFLNWPDGSYNQVFSYLPVAHYSPGAEDDSANSVQTDNHTHCLDVLVNN